MTCCIEDCVRPVYVKKRQLCSVHYNRMLRHGTPTPAGHRIVGDDRARFFARTVVTPGCWLWTKQMPKGVYPEMRIHGANVCVHRWSYEHFICPIPSGYQVDHLCRNIQCVNPDHLEPVTQLENLRRQQAADPRRGRLCDLCDSPHRCKGLCGMHYKRWLNASRPSDKRRIA